MKQRVAKKMRTYRDRLNYSEQQLQRAEETLKESDKRKARRKSPNEAKAQGRPE